jgi:hypothetical protein
MRALTKRAEEMFIRNLPVSRIPPLEGMPPDLEKLIEIVFQE